MSSSGVSQSVMVVPGSLHSLGLSTVGGVVVPLPSASAITWASMAHSSHCS
jgi:hypothetical protein